MSSHRFAYGWLGHIICHEDECSGNPVHNVIAVSGEVFDRIESDHGNCKLDERISVEQLGVQDADHYFLAVGHSFSEGWQYYGTIFEAAEDKNHPNAIDHDQNYIDAMREVYGLDMPPCRFMIGVCTEH